MIIERRPICGQNYIATIAIGQQYLEGWRKLSRSSWIDYCERFDLGLVIFDQDMAVGFGDKWKKPTWQKLLIGKILESSDLDVKNVCYLDTDIIISPFAQNIFESYDPMCFGLVSLRKNLPFDYDKALKAVAYNRNRYYSKDYPLDSALFITTEELYRHHGLEPQADEACMGLIVFNVKNHAGMMSEWFEKYDSNIYSLTSGGDQTHLNYEIQNTSRVQWFDYRFQAIWVFEMAVKYPFLYDSPTDSLILNCIEACLYENHFLHFAGSWHETEMWQLGGLFSDLDKVESFKSYLSVKPTGAILGTIKPKK